MSWYFVHHSAAARVTPRASACQPETSGQSVFAGGPVPLGTPPSSSSPTTRCRRSELLGRCVARTAVPVYIDVAAVPEPTTLLLLGTGLGIATYRRRKARR